MPWDGSLRPLDWTDVCETMVHLEDTHNAVCTFTVSVLGKEAGHRLWVGVVLSTPVLVSTGQLLSVEISHEWPNGDRQDLPALVYQLLLKADEALTRQFIQMGYLEA